MSGDECTMMPCIKLTIKDLTRGFWPAMNKLNNDPSLEFGTKVRVGAIFKDLSKQADEYQKQYETQVTSLKWEEVKDEAGEVVSKKCLELEEKEKIEQTFLNTEIYITGKKIKAEKLEDAKLAAGDIQQLAPIIEGLEDYE